jgi:hypothetical protein
MHRKIRPENFRVEERVALPVEPSGPYTLYWVRKWERTTLEIQAELAARLRAPQRAVIFPAPKDRWAIAVQVAAIWGQGPERMRGAGFEAVRMAMCAVLPDRRTFEGTASRSRCGRRPGGRARDFPRPPRSCPQRALPVASMIRGSAPGAQRWGSSDGRCSGASPRTSSEWCSWPRW